MSSRKDGCILEEARLVLAGIIDSGVLISSRKPIFISFHKEKESHTQKMKKLSTNCKEKQCTFQSVYVFRSELGKHFRVVHYVLINLFDRSAFQILPYFSFFVEKFDSIIFDF